MNKAGATPTPGARRRAWLLVATCLFIAGVCTAATNGPLRPAIASQGENPRYFYDVSDRPVYLTGSHTWDSVQDWGDHRPDFDFEAYLDLLVANGHNFARLWLFEGPSTGDLQWQPRLHPLPWKTVAGGCRTAHGKHDGPVYDLDTENLRPAFLSRLRDRVERARQRGIYVSVMLFQGWSIRQVCCGLDPWPTHPFRDGNNCVVDVAEGRELHQLGVSTTVWNLQRGLIEKVVERLKDMDNVIWEVANESTTDSPDWQNQVVATIRNLEQTGSGYLRRPVGITSVVPPSAATNDALITSPADWVSPSHTCSGGVCGQSRVDCAALSAASGDDYVCDPPDVPNKVVLADTDHMVPLLSSVEPADYRQWIWKSLTRGHNPIVMDAVQNPFSSTIETDPGHPKWAPIRRYLGEARAWAEKLDLSRAVPRGDLCSTGFCLADPREAYLIYRPIGDMGEIVVELEPGMYNVEWMTPWNGNSADYGTIAVPAGGSVEIPTPVMGELVVHLETSSGPAPALGVFLDRGLPAPPWPPVGAPIENGTMRELTLQSGAAMATGLAIQNLGTAQLEIANPGSVLTGSCFGPLAPLPQVLGAGGWYDLVLLVEGCAPGTHVGTLRFETNDPLHPVFSFAYRLLVVE